MTDIRTDLQRTLKWLTIATVTVYLALIGLGIVGWVSYTHQRNDLAQAVQSTNQALCTFRADLEQRVKDARQFLVDHPNGIQGISPAAIQQSIDNQQRTIDALTALDCPPSEIP